MSMDDDKIREICQERLKGWTEKLVQAHATPIMLLGIGHDHKSGELHVLVTEDTTDGQIKLYLAGALKALM